MPTNQNKVAEAKISDLSHDGKGIAKIDGKVVFIAGSLPDETVKFKYTRSKRSYDESKVLEVLTMSPFRVEPKCDFFMVCYGCVLQHLLPDEQIKFKQNSLLSLLSKQSNIVPEQVLAPIKDNVWGYRFKARLGVKVVAQKGVALVGFRKLGSGLLAVMNRCEVLHPEVGYKISALKNLINQMEAGNKIAQIEVAVGDNAGILIFRNLITLNNDDKNLLDQFGQDNNLNIYTQSGSPETIKPLNSKNQVQLFYETNQLRFEFAPNNFTQVNFAINHKMIAQALELLELKNTDRVLDLFCGLGNFTLPISKQGFGVGAKLMFGTRCRT